MCSPTLLCVLIKEYNINCNIHPAYHHLDSFISNKSTQTNITIPPDDDMEEANEKISNMKCSKNEKKDDFDLDNFDGHIENLPHSVFENVASHLLLYR